MNIVYRLQGIEFEWDTNKAQSNLEKHNLRFEEAAEVFLERVYKFGKNLDLSC